MSTRTTTARPAPPFSTVPFDIDWFGLSDRGKVRKTNQDRFLVAELGRSVSCHLSHGSATTWRHSRGTGHVFLVVDGVGGQAGGERASEVAVETLSRLLERQSASVDLATDLAHAPQECHVAIRNLARTTPRLRGMGATFTLAYASGTELAIVHVGDSRCYLFRDRRLRQLTTDHTYAQWLRDAGRLSEADARNGRGKHLLWNALGAGGEEVKPELHRHRLRAEDSLLLCSDGLLEGVAEAEVCRCLRHPSPADSCADLIELARRAGGRDNMTAVVATFRAKIPGETA